MDVDLILVIGMVLAAFSIPALFAAFSDSRPPRAGAILLLIGGVLMVVAISRKTGGYTFAEIPDVVLNVIGRYLN